MREINLTEGEPVAKRGPGRLLQQLQIQTFLGGKGQFLGNDKGRTINKGQISATGRRQAHCNRSAVVTSAVATSITLRP